MGIGTTVDKHLSEELVERYTLGHASETEAALVEEHILLCELCQEKLQEVDDFVHAFRIAAPKAAGPETASKAGFWNSIAAYLRPMPVAGLAAAAAVTLVLLVPRDPAVMESRVMELRAIRSDVSSVAKTNESLTLRLDAEGLPGEQSFIVEIVAAGGDMVWSGKAAASNGVLVVSPGAIRNKGAYWVRVLRADDSRSLLREFALEIRPAG